MNDKSGGYCTYFCLEISLTCRFNSENRRFCLFYNQSVLQFDVQPARVLAVK